MSYTLILDSSNLMLSVGLMKDNTLIDVTSYPCFQRQSEVMIPEIHNLLNKHQVKTNELKAVVTTIGPGSYTGIRIALTIAKVMATLLNIPLYPISSLDAYRLVDRKCICLINARSNRSYIAIYNNNECILKPSVLTNDEVKELINKYSDYVLVGDLKYLGLSGEESNALLTISKILNTLEPSDPNKVKPLYLKDLYE